MDSRIEKMGGCGHQLDQNELCLICDHPDGDTNKRGASSTFPSYTELEAAVTGAHKASSVLQDLVHEVAELPCPSTVDPGGSDAFSSCEQDTCLVCRCKKFRDEHL